MQICSPEYVRSLPHEELRIGLVRGLDGQMIGLDGWHQRMLTLAHPSSGGIAEAAGYVNRRPYLAF